MDQPTLLTALVLGIVEGLTEFLPVSSTGHLIVSGSLLGYTGDQAKVFEIVIQAGAILAVCWEYRARLLAVAWGLGSEPRSRRFVLNLFVAFLPAAVLGLAFGKMIKAHLFAPVPVACAFVVGALVILWAERRQAARPDVVRIASVDEMRWPDALKVGLAQALALVPGTSRSGATIIGGMLFGLSRTAATEFSFFLAIPTLFAATAYEVVRNRHLLVAHDLPAFGVGFAASFVSAFLCVRWLIRYVSHHNFIPFVWYRIAFGALILVTAYAGLVQWGLSARWIGPLFAVVGVFGFSAKAILIKLAYAAHPIDPLSLLTLRMLYAAPFFAAMVWWSNRARDAPRLSRADWRSVILLGFIGYYAASLLDFMGLVYITAALERLVLYLYPTFVVLLSALLLGKPITRRAVAALALSYAGIVLVFAQDLRSSGAPAAIWTGGALVLVSAMLHSLYLVGAGRVIGRLGSMRFISRAMLVSTGFVLAQFAFSRDATLRDVPASVHLLGLAMAIVATVLPTWLVAESIRRIGANASSLIGSLGPVFTIGLGALVLAEPVEGIQLAGAALVLAGVMLVTLRPPAGGTQA